MNVMAEGAVEGRVLALVVLKFGNLLGMAGEAGIGHVLAKRNDFRSVRVPVTAETIGQFIVRLVLMTHAALRDDFLYCGGVSHMTVLATEGRLVGLPFGLN